MSAGRAQSQSREQTAPSHSHADPGRFVQLLADCLADGQYHRTSPSQAALIPPLRPPHTTLAVTQHMTTALISPASLCKRLQDQQNKAYWLANATIDACIDAVMLSLYERGILDLHVWTTSAGQPDIWSFASSAATSTSTRHWPCCASCDVSLKV